MAEFSCRIGADGMISERSIAAPSAASARERLLEEGFEVFAVRRRDGLSDRLADAFGGGGKATPGSHQAAWESGASPVTPGGRRRTVRRGFLSRAEHVPTAHLLLLAQELAALIQAGLPLLRCLDILRQRRAATATGEVLDRVRSRVAGGGGLSAAFDQEDAASRIPRLFVTSLAVGETSGDLEGALRRYAQYLERAQTLRRRVRGALLYPAALFTVSMAVVAILVGFVLPRFADFYATYDAELPLLTRLLISVGGVFRGQAYVILIGVPIAVLTLLVAARSETGGRLRDEWGLRIPLLGGLRRLYLDVEASHTIATLLRGGSPLTSALAVAADGTQSSVYRTRLRRVRDLVSQGNSFHGSLESVGLLDATGLEMVEVGEATGSLEAMLGHVASSYDEMLDRRLNTAVALLEPIVLVSMGIFLAAVLLSLYLPLFQTAQVV